MNRSSERTIRKFNPGVFQSDQEVIDQFVVRSRELDTVLEILRGNIGAPSCQHTLVVGPRGRGKTMLLARVAAEVRTDPDLGDALLPVRYMEESLEIFDIGDFWLEALYHLAKECARHHPDLSAEIEKTRVDLARRARAEDIAGHARAGVLDAADRLGRRLVLMVENLQDLCDDVEKDFGWQLRESLQSDPEVMLLASATSRFEALEDARQPFFELFRILQLEPLDTEECRRLWQVVSDDSPKQPQMRPLEIFTGGSPRLLVILAQFGRHRSMPDLLEGMVGLIDDHTEYFRGHLDALPRTERRVYLAVADLWQPSGTREVADRARLGVRETSSLLGRLVKRGAVRTEGDGRNRLYAVSERLYCIYYKLRHQRDEATVVRGVIRFMVAFYGSEEAAPLLGGLLGDGAFRDRIFGKEKDLDLGEIPAGMASATYEDLAKRYSNLGKHDCRRRVAGELMDIGSGFGRFDQFERSMEYSDEVIRRFVSDPDPEVGSMVVKAFVTRAMAMAMAKSGRRREALGMCSEVVARFTDLRMPEVQECVGMALLCKGSLHGDLGEPDEAIAAYDEVVDRFGGSRLPGLRLCVALSLRMKGSVLAVASPDAAQVAWNDMVERFIDDDLPEIQFQVAGTMVKQVEAAIVGRKGELAIGRCDAVVRRYGGSEDSRVLRLVALALERKGKAQNQLDRPGEALATYETLAGGFGTMEGFRGLPVSWRAMWIKVQALSLQGDEAAALRAFRILCDELKVDNRAMLRKFVRDTIDLVVDLVARGASPSPFTDVLGPAGLLQLDGQQLGGASLGPFPFADVFAESDERSEALVPLFAALRRLSGRSMRVPEEISQAADDVIRMIEDRTRSARST